MDVANGMVQYEELGLHTQAVLFCHLLMHRLKAEMELAILSFTPLGTRVKESDMTG